MTISEYMNWVKPLDKQFSSSDGKKLSETIAEATHIWSNDVAKGYLIDAAQRIDLPREQICRLLLVIEQSFSDFTQDEAEKILNKFYNHRS